MILNLQTTDGELAKRLIDFASGLTYALDGGMQKIAEKTFLLTPAQRRGLGRGEGPADREGLLQPVLSARGGYGFARRMKVGFAGAGNMAAAMARGWAAGDGGPEAMLFCDRARARAAALAAEVGGEARRHARRAGAELATRVVLAVKPAALERGRRAARRRRRRRSLSVLGATPLARLREVFPGVPVLRVMPNHRGRGPARA